MTRELFYTLLYQGVYYLCFAQGGFDVNAFLIFLITYSTAFPPPEAIAPETA